MRPATGRTRDYLSDSHAEQRSKTYPGEKLGRGRIEPVQPRGQQKDENTEARQHHPISTANPADPFERFGHTVQNVDRSSEEQGCGE